MAPLPPVGPARDPPQHVADSNMFLNRRNFAYGSPWLSAEFSGVRASATGHVGNTLDRALECAPAGGQNQAGVLTICRAC
jgi:hypothetical protein